jgi:DNA-binding IclR family transcriptional regulator
MSILENVVASGSGGMRLAELSEVLQAPKSSLHALAKGLVAAGYLREDDGRYFYGPAISSLLAFEITDLPALYHHALEQLASRWNETAMLATLVGDSVVYLDAVEPDAFIRAVPKLHARLSLWPRSSGQCFLAFMPPKRLDTYLRRHHSDEQDAEEVRRALAKVRETRVGINIGGAVADHIGIASPVVNGSGAVTVAIAMAGPQSRMTDKLDEMTRDLRETVEAITRTSPS